MGFRLSQRASFPGKLAADGVSQSETIAAIVWADFSPNTACVRISQGKTIREITNGPRGPVQEAAMAGTNNRSSFSAKGHSSRNNQRLAGA